MQTRRGIVFLFPLLLLAGIPTPSLAWQVWIVYFDEASAELGPDGKLVTRDALAAIYDSEVKKVIITGHADPTEADAAALSLKRAVAMRDELYRLGLPKSFPVEIEARGASDPARPNASAENRMENRRAVFELARDCRDPRLADGPLCSSRAPP